MTRFGLERLRQVLVDEVERDGLRPFARQHGLAVGVIRSIIDGRDTSFSNTMQVAEALQIPAGVFYEATSQAKVDPEIEIAGDDFAPILRLVVEASAGAGALNHDTPEVAGRLAFRRDWLRRIGVKPDRATLITVTGDSMAPELRPGDLALIDQDRATWEHNKVFALVDLDGGVRIKRILLDKGRALVLMSDNPAHLPEARTGSDAARVRCLGRVVWSGHSWE